MALLDANDDLADVLGGLAIPRYHDMKVELPGTSTPARVRLILPPGLREHEEFVFPLIVNV